MPRKNKYDSNEKKKNELVDQLGDWCHTDIHLKPFPPNLSL